jgi:hypothetical protein
MPLGQSKRTKIFIAMFGDGSRSKSGKMGGHANFGPHSHRRIVPASTWCSHRNPERFRSHKVRGTPTGPFVIDFRDIG